MSKRKLDDESHPLSLGAPNEYELMPSWAQAHERATTLASLFADDWLEPGLWRLLFQPAPERQARGHACSAISGRRVESYELDWTSERIVFRFAKPAAEREWSLTRLEPVALTMQGGRLFPVQRDGFLCGTHSLNALARGALLNPASVFETMLLMRDSVDPAVPFGLYAQRDELIVAALREGVVLGCVLLSDLTQLAMLKCGAQLPVPPHRAFEHAVGAAGGLILHFASADGEGGHYVTVLPLADGSWAVYDTSAVTLRGDSLGDALHQAIAARSVGSASLQTLEVVALVPLVPRVSAVLDGWRASTLRNSEARDIGGGRVHLNAPVTTPIALSAASVAIGALPSELVRSTQFNLYTYYAARTRFETEMNDKAQEIAACLCRLPADRTQFRGMAWTIGPAEALAELPTHLAQLGSLLRSYIGLLFVPTAVLANREWLRYVVVHIVARRLRAALLLGATPRLYRLAAALAAVAFTWHRYAGHVEATIRARYPAVDDLYQVAHVCLSMQEVFGDAGTDTAFGVRAVTDIATELTKPANYLGKMRLDRSLWLLHSARRAGVALPLELADLELLDTHKLDSGAPRADSLPALDTLRAVAFATPDSRSVHAAEQRVRAAVHQEGAPTPATSTARADVAVRVRRRNLAVWFCSLLRDDAEPRRLLFALGLPLAYANSDGHSLAEIHAAAEIEALGQLRPALLEQAYVRASAEEMFTTVFDSVSHDERRLPLVPVSSRFVCDDANGHCALDATTLGHVRAFGAAPGIA